jgi:starch-binding outer membrane protein, SusD/RagB family
MKKIIRFLVTRIASRKIIVLFSVVFGLNACEEFIKVDPPSNQLIRSTVFEDDVTAKATILAIYSQISFSGAAYTNFSFTGGISSDELTLVNSSDIDLNQFYQNSLSSTNPKLTSFWNTNYKYVYYANAIIEGLEKSTKVTTSLKQQLIGEAKFIRAFAHFYLTNLFGDIPYITTTDYEKNTLASRIPVDEVYKLIIRDFQEAKNQLAGDYSYSSGQRIRINKYAATAMLARAHLYAGNWPEAEAESTEVINKTDYYSLVGNLSQVFLMGSTEAIWQLQVPNQNYTNEGNLFLSPGILAYSKISDNLMNSFETGDNRKNNWTQQVVVNSEIRFVPSKYKDFNPSATLREYTIVLRLAEQFLIRAEARAQQSKLIGSNSAESDINIIRQRAGLAPTIATTKDQLLIAILNERRSELFIEWGHRWLDLNRTGKANEVLELVKPAWDSFDKYYPIPNSEVLVNPNLRQNDGY